MKTLDTWPHFEGSIEDICRAFPSPLAALAQGKVPALVLRNVYKPSHCSSLIERFYEKGLLYNPHELDHPHRVDIGTSFGTHRLDREVFFSHSSQTSKLFSTLFEGYDDPIQAMYDTLTQLATDKEVKTAREPDGQLYGPAIFRAYYAGLGHGPHYDSVAKRTKAFDYQVSRFEHQFSGVLCFQNSDGTGESGAPFLYNCPWDVAVQEQLNKEKFHQYIVREQIERVQIDLEPGDLYFFFSENIHEVPPVIGESPRIVLAIFFAMSLDDDEIYVWA